MKIDVTLTPEKIKDQYIKAQGVFGADENLANRIYDYAELIFNDGSSPYEMNRKCYEIRWLGINTPIVKVNYYLNYIGMLGNDIDSIPVSEDYLTEFINDDGNGEIEPPEDFEFNSDLDEDDWDVSDWEAEESYSVNYDALEQIEYFIKLKRQRMEDKFKQQCKNGVEEFIEVFSEKAIALHIPTNKYKNLSIDTPKGFKFKMSTVTKKIISYLFEYTGR